MPDSPRRALITGISGQDGSYLAELLLARNYEVHGLVRRSSHLTTTRLDHLYQEPRTPGVRLFLHHGDMTDGSSLRRLLSTTRPDEIYNLAAQSHVRVSFEQAEYTTDVVALGTLRLLEAARDYSEVSGQAVRIYQASSSEMFGSTPPPQNESTPFHPVSPYAIAKLAAHHLAGNFRESYGMFIACGILFNHESPRRGETFVTRKVTRAAARISLGMQQTLFLGNLDATRDWGFAGDYVEAMWLMLQQERAKDYVISTGESYSVRQLLDEAFAVVGLKWEDYVQIDPYYFRPAEVNALHGDSSLARQELGWAPKVSFKELVGMMVRSDLEAARKEL